MIKKLYDFRQIALPAPLLQAEVTREEMDAELALAAARFTAIASVDGPVAAGDVVALEYTDDKGLHRLYVNVGKGFDPVEEQLPGLVLGQKLQLRYAGREVEACVVAIKRLRGVECHGGTSCPDQLAVAIAECLQSMGETV